MRFAWPADAARLPDERMSRQAAAMMISASEFGSGTNTAVPPVAAVIKLRKFVTRVSKLNSPQLESTLEFTSAAGKRPIKAVTPLEAGQCRRIVSR